MRAFVGIELDAEVRETIAAAIDSVKRADPRWKDARWVAAENLHVTLKFLDEIPEEAESEALDALKQAADGVAPFLLPVLGVRAVPALRRARMMWVDLQDPEGACAGLAGRVELAFARLDVPIDERPFRPHITIVRARRPGGIAPGAIDEARALTGGIGSVSVRSCTLFHSVLTPRGAVYRKLGAAVLEGD